MENTRPIHVDSIHGFRIRETGQPGHIPDTSGLVRVAKVVGSPDGHGHTPLGVSGMSGPQCCDFRQSRENKQAFACHLVSLCAVTRQLASSHVTLCHGSLGGGGLVRGTWSAAYQSSKPRIIWNLAQNEKTYFSR